MSYDKEVFKKLKRGADGLSNIYKVTLAKDYAVVEGHKGVLYFSNDKIVLRLKSSFAVTLEGKGLSIAASQKEEIIIKGKVLSVTVGEEKI